MFKRINRCDIYIGLWVLYMLQGVVYSPGIVNQFLQLVMLLWGMTAFFSYITQSIMHRSSILRTTFILIIMYAIYGSIHIMFGERMLVSNYVYLQSSLNSLVPIFLFYSFTKNKYLTSDRIRIYLPIIIITCILLYYKKEASVMLKLNKEEVTNNIGYMFTSLIPFLFFYHKKIFLQYVFMVINLLFIFMGMKRGAILVGVLCTAILLYANLKESSRGIKILTISLSSVIVIGFCFYVDYLMGNSAYFALRLEQTLEGNSSGRDMIYGKMWDTLLQESNILYFLFGRGADYSVRIVGNYAHQDWLETFCNNGLIGVIILFSFFYSLGKSVLRSRRYFPPMMYYSFFALFIITFSKTLISMSIQNLDLYQSLLIGYFAYKVLESSQNLRKVI